MLPYGRQSVDEADITAVEAVLRGDWLTTGPAVAEFEHAISRRAGGHHTTSCSSGTAALHIAYAALGVGPGDEVVTSPITFVATASGASLHGATVRFADVEEDTALIDPDAVDALVTERTRVVAAVDYAGHPADYDRLRQVAQRAEAHTLADAAHSVGGTYKQRPVGSLADVTAMSFFPTKNLTTGEGGAVVAKDPVVGRAAAEFHNVGLVREPGRWEYADEGPWHQEVHTLGLNYRLTDLGAALGMSQLARLDSFARRRREIKHRYDTSLAGVDSLRLPVQRAEVDPVWHLYPVRVLGGRRREVFTAMRERGIGVQVNYLPVYRHPVYARNGYRRGMCPNAEAFYAEELSLPMYPDLSDDQVDRVVEALVDCVDR